VALKLHQTLSQIFPKLIDQMDKKEVCDPVYNIPYADLLQEFHWRNTEKIHNKKRGASKGLSPGGKMKNQHLQTTR